jgi:type II secretory pathway pseudopilin PulG
MFRCRKCPSAFSIIELVVASSLFLGLLVVVFLFFRYGTRAFMTATQRQGVQADALRVMDGLQADMKRTSGSSVVFRNDASRTRLIDGVTVHRDAVCFAGLKDWSDPTSTENFDVTNAQPIWNRYWVYYATADADRGRLVRLKVDPTPPPIAPRRMLTGELDQLSRNDPSLNSYSGLTPAYVYLAANVYEFHCTSVSRNQFQVSLKLQEKRRLRPDGGTIQGFETYQLIMNVRPENTIPQDL